jgi:hypothetical protein
MPKEDATRAQPDAQVGASFAAHEGQYTADVSARVQTPDSSGAGGNHSLLAVARLGPWERACHTQPETEVFFFQKSKYCDCLEYVCQGADFL